MDEGRIQSVRKMMVGDVGNGSRLDRLLAQTVEKKVKHDGRFVLL